MSTEDPVPDPPQTPSASGQEARQGDSDLVLAEPLTELPIARTISGLASTHSRSMGGEFSAALIAGATSQIAHELSSVKAAQAQTQLKLETAQEKLSAANIENAVLRERIESDKGARHLRNFAIFAGTTLLAAAIQLGNINQKTYAVAAGVGGIVLVLLGWFIIPARRKS